MKQSDLNHLRRLLGWVRCDIGQDPAGQQQTMIDIAGKLGIDSIDADAKARLVQGYRRAEAVPVYVRDAVKALEKALAAGGRGPGAAAPRATAETRANAGFDGGARHTDDVVLPPLPKPVEQIGFLGGRPQDLFDIEGLRTYARAAVLADRQQRAGDAVAAEALAHLRTIANFGGTLEQAKELAARGVWRCAALSTQEGEAC